MTDSFKLWAVHSDAAGETNGFGTSVGFGLLPIFALLIGYPGGFVLMAVGIVAMIAIRRLEGLEEDRRDGVPIARAVVGRLLFDLPRGGKDFS